MELTGKVVLITGSAERVGRETALLLARRGAEVVIQYRSKPEKAESAAAEVAAIRGSRPLTVYGDISRRQDWEAMRDAVLERHGRIDVLVNNAAIFYKTPFLDSGDDEWDHFMNVNLRGVYLGCRIVGEVMVRQGGGKIVNVVDVAAERVWPSYIPYCVSKAGVAALTKGLAQALAPTVTVNGVAPGTVLLAEEYDPAEEQALIDRTPLKRVGEPGDIARAIAFLIADGDFVNGAIIPVDGGRSLA